MASLLIHNIGMLATATGSAAKAGAAQGEICILRNAYVAVQDDTITAVGEGAFPQAFLTEGCTLIDAQGKLLTAGLVDAHTHLVFGGWREDELALKLHGVPYLDILAQGGGILSTVRATRKASEDELYDKTAKALDTMLSYGTTTCEAKSGYGLDMENELKQLRVVHCLNEGQPVELISTFMAAHALPEEYKDNREGYLALIIDRMLPYVAEHKLAEYCDVFCETGVFTPAESQRILTAAQKLGLGAKIHADEIDPIGGSQLAGQIGSVSAEHLIVCPDEGIASMAKGGTIACLLPATSFYLGATFAPAKKMIEAGVPVAIATDFNPGSTPNLSLQLAMNIACYRYRMTPEETLTAATLNAAAAIAARTGSAPSKPASRPTCCSGMRTTSTTSSTATAPTWSRRSSRPARLSSKTSLPSSGWKIRKGRIPMKLTEMKVNDFIDLLASDAPAPGGGSASALAGAMGVGLSKMVAALTTGKAKYAEHEDTVQEILSKAGSLTEKLTAAIDRDTEAFDGVSAVFAMPKSTDEEKAARKEAMQKALKEATLVPYETMELCLQSLKVVKLGVGKTNTSAASDLGVASLNLKSAVQGAWLNVLINLAGIKDEAFVAEYKSKGEAILAEALPLADEIYNDILKSL